jgi:hypothetical protein
MRTPGAVFGLVVLATGGLLLSAAPAGAAASVDYWRWSDGVDSAARTFAEDRFRVPANLPWLIVSTEPAAPGHLVRLQYREGPVWRTEAAARMDAGGVASLELNPYCPDGDWCNRTYAYRLVVDGAVAPLTITYRR